jgi:ferredoxin
MLAVPNFRAERCVRYRYAYSECNRCGEACPHEAIRLFDAGAEVLAGMCQGCALCIAACPTDALTEKSVSADSLLKIAGDKKRLIIACAPSAAKGDAIVPCLGALGPVLLATFAKRGITLQLNGATHCAKCAHAATGPGMIESHRAARDILCGIDVARQWAPLETTSDEATSVVEEQEHDAARRGLFRRIIGHGADVASGKFEAAPAPLNAIRAAAPFLPDRKEMLNSLYDAPVEEPVRVARHPSIPAENWVVAQGCTNCEACVRVCPTGAMQLLENDESWRLVLLPERCVACDVCVEVCQPKVLRQRDADSVVASKQKGRLLRTVPRRRCTTCGRPFVADGDAGICRICASDHDDFASIFG